ncbi:MAG: hypothetical protein ACYC9U_08495 [Nitrososphaerales archaeon]
MRLGSRAAVTITLAVALMVVTGVAVYSFSTSSSNTSNNNSAPKTVSSLSIRDATTTQVENLQARFGILSQATSDVCISGYGQSSSFLKSQSNGAYLQGSCCYPMVYSHYEQQIGGLKAYSNIPVIPPDPYNVSVSLVKQMFSLANIPLDPQQNATFTQTLQLSKEGLCCCQCWAWYFHEGLVKYLITNYNWTPSSLSNLLALEDCCGGA